MSSIRQMSTESRNSESLNPSDVPNRLWIGLNPMGKEWRIVENASRNSRSFGRKNLLNVEGLIRFYPTKYNIIAS